jgi:hypothetical protein
MRSIKIVQIRSTLSAWLGLVYDIRFETLLSLPIIITITIWSFLVKHEGYASDISCYRMLTNSQ